MIINHLNLLSCFIIFQGGSVELYCDMILLTLISKASLYHSMSLTYWSCRSPKTIFNFHHKNINIYTLKCSASTDNASQFFQLCDVLSTAASTSNFCSPAHALRKMSHISPGPNIKDSVKFIYQCIWNLKYRKSW